MDFLPLAFLALVQGVTEFLPVSSSAHLILLPKLMHFADQGLLIDVALHMGTLLAVMLYFYQDTFNLVIGFKHLLFRQKSAHSRLTFNIIIATLPVIFLGFLFKSFVAGSMRTAAVIGATSIIFGLVLLIADNQSKKNKANSNKNYFNMPLKHAFIIGLFQALALIPGVSRSGITMSAALFLSYARVESAKFSLLLSIPTILAAFLLATYDLWLSKDNFLVLNALISLVLSFIFAYLTLWLLMRFLQKYSFKPFVIYRLLLGFFILWFFYGS